MPESERPKVYRTARIYLAIYALVIVACVAFRSILPAMYIGLPSLYGGWLQLYFGCTQHLGLAEDVLDHRLNSRTIYMNPIFRFLYWNMNYHVEHHLFPLIPYHALPKLHEAIKADCPPPYPSTIAAYREIIPALARQLKDPTYYVRRELPVRQSAVAQSASRLRESLQLGMASRHRQLRYSQRAARFFPTADCLLPQERDHTHERDLDRRRRRRQHPAGGRRALRARRPFLRPLPDGGRPLFRHRRPLHPRAGRARRRLRFGHDHRVPDAQRPLRLHHRRSQGRARLRQSRHLSGEGRGRPDSSSRSPEPRQSPLWRGSSPVAMGDGGTRQNEGGAR